MHPKKDIFIFFVQFLQSAASDKHTVFTDFALLHSTLVHLLLGDKVTNATLF